MTTIVQGSTEPVEGTQYNWGIIAIIVVAIIFFSQQKGCDLGNILPKPNNVNKVEIAEPVAKYKTADLEAFKQEAGKNKLKAAYLTAYYSAFADIISRNPTVVSNTTDFRRHHANSLDLMFKSDSKLSDPEMGTEIEAFLDDFIDKVPKPLDVNELKNVLLALAWAAQNA